MEIEFASFFLLFPQDPGGGSCDFVCSFSDGEFSFLKLFSMHLFLVFMPAINYMMGLTFDYLFHLFP